MKSLAEIVSENKHNELAKEVFNFKVKMDTTKYGMIGSWDYKSDDDHIYWMIRTNADKNIINVHRVKNMLATEKELVDSINYVYGPLTLETFTEIVFQYWKFQKGFNY